MKPTAHIRAAYSLFALLHLAHGHPTVQQSSQGVTLSISPGPGLPSLEELGITVEDLLFSDDTQNNVNRRGTDTTLYNPKCYHVNTSTTGPVQLCYNYLNKIGSQTCLANRDVTWAYMCNATMGDKLAFVRGQPASGVSETSSPCSNVARGMEWVMQQCVTAQCGGDNCVLGGTNAAYANGNFVIEVVGNATVISSS